MALFQFDYDMSFAMFFMNADKTIYGRFGTRNGNAEESDDEISLEGLRESMQAALALHKGFDKYRSRLIAKAGNPPPQKTPLDFPDLGKKFGKNVDYNNPKVATTCLHCHMIHGETRKQLRKGREPFPEPVLYPWPMPDTIGMHMDPKKRSTVKKVLPDSIASKAGVQPKDVILAFNHQPIISTADLQFVLHNAGESTRLPLVIRRGGRSLQLTLQLQPAWRRTGDIKWRVSTWDLRRMALGGMVLKRAENNHSGHMELEVTHVGKYGDHRRAMQAGVRKGDTVVGIAGLTSNIREQDVIHHILHNTQPGDYIDVRVKRSDRTIDTKFRVQ